MYRRTVHPITTYHGINKIGPENFKLYPVKLANFSS